MVDLLGHLAYVALIGGQLLVANKTRVGFLVRVVGSLVWAWIGLQLGLSSIVLWSLAFAVVDLLAWRRWAAKHVWVDF